MRTPSRTRPYSEFIECLNVGIRDTLKKGGTHDEISHRIISKLQFDCGGLVIYIPKGCANTSNVRDRLILSEFNGTNHYELAMKYGLSVQRIYYILKHKKHHEKSDF